ncbi:putative methyltransferase-domain-containing protein [Halteromyces radiatus]|uniref:putative methyltransferase-domain-containing protein n=1 Tax=Halteromyces radiatus TaxID=101107 RepID=UPI0022204F90|nr:putative methyltransferase-domain-containing protein [Halteromyces radiatus]KAI8088839.1 putative methyltransferase-domain-containing protein [Halteromyces radiatus]
MALTNVQADEKRIYGILKLNGEDTDQTDSNNSSDSEQGRHITKETVGNVQVALWQDVSGGCGGRTWEAAYVMIKYMLWKERQGETSFLSGKKILDLGSGTGLVGLAMAKACPSLAHMELTDQIPMMSLLHDNILLNQLQDKVSASVLNWGEPTDHTVDIVFASDCVYLEVAFQPLVDTLVMLTENNNNVQIYMSYRKRRKADKRFFGLARKQFNIIDIMDDPERPVYSRQGLHLYRLERKIHHHHH